jgi:1-aminocyclopropane-1-carboxylate deaminase/D-cysteine desulfhydrase-like pyridoxal-dependent ACC family enzyme
MSKALGIKLWIKRDDLTGFAMGGNKGRKLEYLMADVLASGAKVVVTCGATQSNFIRQLAAACTYCGIVCAAAVMDAPFDTEPASQRPAAKGGNVVLDGILGVELRWHPDGTWDELYVLADNLAAEFEAYGKPVYRMPVGGSSALGAYAFLRAANEIKQEFDAIVFASSSGSTHTGLAFAYAGTNTRILGIACDPEPEISKDFAVLARGLKDLVPEGPDLAAEDYDLDFSFVGPGYGVPSEAGNLAIRWLARTEGIFLDPIYSGKAFAGLMELAGRKELTGKVLFWHTGGLPALFAY